MFKFSKERIVKDWPAEISVAMDGGRVKKYPFTLDLKILDTEEYREIAAEGDRKLLGAFLKGFKGIADEAGDPLPFNEDSLDNLAVHPGFMRAALAAYMKAANGEASRKN